MSFIIEDTILFSTVELGIKDPTDKATCDKLKKLVTHEMMKRFINFTMLFQIEDGPACIVFSVFLKRSIKYPQSNFAFGQDRDTPRTINNVNTS